MSGPLAEWVTVHYGAQGPLPELDPHARFVLVVLALSAKHGGSDANLTREQISDQTGLSPPAISRALRRIIDAKAIAQGSIPGPGRPRVRQVRIWWCDHGCFTCELLAGFQDNGKGVTGDNPSGRKVVTSRRKSVTSDNPLRYERGALTGQQRLAMLNARQSARRDPAPPGSGGRSRPAPWNPPTARRQAAELASKPSDQASQAIAVGRQADPAQPEWRAKQAWSGARMATVLPFQADRTSRPAAAGGTA